MKNINTLLIAAIMAIMLFPGVSFSHGLRFRPISPFFTSPSISSISIRGTRSGDTMTNVRIDPFKKTYVDRDTRIWWENYSDTPISIKIGHGNDCKEIINGSSMQLLNPMAACEITKQPILPNGSMIVSFDEASTYDFEIRFLGTNTVEKGQIVVF